MSTPSHTPSQRAMLAKLRDMVEAPLIVTMSNGELGFKIAPRERICLSCGAKPNQSGEIPCGH
jgi:hypothetical protein